MLSESGSDVSTYSDKSRPYGLSYGQWTVKWWQWAVSFSEHLSPVIDRTGKLANSKQPFDVFFLAGIYGDTGKIFPTRKCVIPSGKSILFPVINYEANVLEYPDLRNEDDILTNVANHMNSIVVKECFINGKSIVPKRVHSDPKIFPLSVNKDMPGLDCGKNTFAASDGFWIFLKPLRRGKYKISFRGSCENGTLSSGANYQLVAM